ncbi:hypothetical protein DERF_012287, partial [Dermatophagoides farinae]
KILFSDVWKRKFVARISTRIWIETKVSLRGPMNNIKRLCQDIIVQKYYGIEKLISFYGIITKKDGDINQMVIEARKIIKREAEFDKFKYFEKIIDQIKWNNTVNLNKILRYEFDCDKDEFMLIDKCQYLDVNESLKITLEKIMSQSSKSGNQATSFASLSDILANSSSTKRTTRSSIRASTAATSGLNLSRAFGGLPSSFCFDSNDQSSSLLASTSNDHQEFYNNINNNLNTGRQKRQQLKREHRGSQNAFKTEAGSCTSVYNDTEREITHIIRQIELTKNLNFKDDDPDDKDRVHQDRLLPEFNLIQLPVDFNLDHGQINVYQSGIIEIVSGDPNTC